MATYDAYIAARPEDLVRGLNIFDFGGAKAGKVTGFHKVILQWLKCFLTAQGSDLDSQYGTSFGSALGTLNNDPQLLRDMVTLSVRTATQTIQGYQRETTVPDTERLLNVQLTNLVVLADRADIYLSFRNVAGTGVNVVVPTGLRAPISSE